MLEYASIYLNKQSSEYGRILNVMQWTLWNIYDGAFCKKNNAWVQARNQTFFKAGEVLWS